MKQRIIVILNRIVVCGQTRDVLPLLFYLKEEFDILVVYGKKDKDHIDESYLLNELSLQAQYVSSLKRTYNPLNDVLAFFKIKRIIKNFKPQIVHTHGFKSGLIGRLAARYAGVPVIMHTYHGHFFHSYFNTFFTGLLKQLERSLSRFTNIIISLSATQAAELAETYKVVTAQKIRVIHLGIDFKPSCIKEKANQLFRQKYSVADNEVLIGVVGRLAPIKNIAFFLQVAHIMLAQQKLPVRFMIIGDGYLKKSLQDLCDSLHISWSETFNTKADVIFTSWIEDIIPTIQSLDILVLTSLNEGTPLSIIEAQFCGKPVVATNVGGVADTLINGETGFLVEAGNITLFAPKLELLVKDKSLRENMGKKAATFAEAHFSKKAEVENYKQLYKSLLAIKTQSSTHQQVIIE